MRIGLAGGGEMGNFTGNHASELSEVDLMAAGADKARTEQITRDLGNAEVAASPEALFSYG